MAGGIFGIGLSGLTAAQAGLVTTGHNIANVSTPGFHRQQVVQSNATPQYTGGGFIGTGVEVDTVRRAYSEFLDDQVYRAQSQAAYYKTYHLEVSNIDNILGDPAAGLAPQLEAFFAAVNEVAAHPASMSSRQTLMSAGASLATRFQSLDNQFVEMNRGVNAQIETTVETINTYAQQIAALNARISASRADPRQAPNDLIDTRDELIGRLNELVGARTIAQDDGSVVVTVGNGQSLVVGRTAFRLDTVLSAEVPDQLDLAYVAGATTVTLTPSTITHGTLGALIAYRAGPLTDARNELGRIAAGLAQSFNEQHALGQDLSGAMGGNFFTLGAGSVRPHTSNTGNAVISATIASANALVASDYRLMFVGGLYQLTRLSDGNTTSYAGLPQTVDGVTIAITGGVIAAGDSYFIEPTRKTAENFNLAFADPAKIAAAAPMRSAAALANAGNGVISAGVVNPPLNVNVQQPVSIVFTSANTFDVVGVGTGNPVGVAYTPGANITYNGWTVKITGAPANGDAFSVSPNINGVADNRNIALLADLQVASILSNGTATLNSAYAQLTSSVGNITHDSQIASTAQEAIALRSRQVQQSLSGVNLDEEAANLMRYQQAYQASGKVLQVASTMFDTILAIGN
ncbi:MAG: flagellar hook-associated protein FlgK [Pseudomonadota bacterium]